MKHKYNYQARYTRHRRIRRKLTGTAERPRVVVFRSNRHFYAQVIDDQRQHTLTAFSSLNLPSRTAATNQAVATVIGTKLAENIKQHQIKQVVFDRAGYAYHGKVAAFAAAVRKAGIVF